MDSIKKILNEIENNFYNLTIILITTVINTLHLYLKYFPDNIFTFSFLLLVLLSEWDVYCKSLQNMAYNGRDT